MQVPSSAWDEYAQRDETRREHLLELQTHYGIRSFTLGQYRSLAAWLLSTALQTNRGIALVRAAIEELRRRSVIVPRLPVLERLCAETALRAQRQLFATLSANLTDNQRRQLDAVLEPLEGRQLSVLAWLRSPSGIPNPRNILTHINALREHGIVFPDALLTHVSPIGWEHINLTGDYTWHANRRVAEG